MEGAQRLGPLLGRRHYDINDLSTQRFFCASRHFAQRAFWAARMRAIAAADIVRLLRVAVGSTFCPLALAQRARCAAAIRARPAADIPPAIPWFPTDFSDEMALLRFSS